MLKKKLFQIDVFGVVQGVGFRPHIYNQILKLNLLGTIQNRGDSVRLLLEGESSAIEYFVSNIKLFIPPLALIEKIISIELDLLNFLDLLIIESFSGDTFDISIPEDLATCDQCLLEFFDPKNRRYLYPFIACTNCGPRYTVVETMPYDRKNTSLKDFPLCEECLQEYKNPLDRRFHAESMACKNCGPKLWLENLEGERIDQLSIENLSAKIMEQLLDGKIIALRALGGFQLICDARNEKAIKKLRQKKLRPSQSFALMANDLESIKKECEVSLKEEDALRSHPKPILILELKKETTLPLNQIAPDLYTLGVMLPTTPLHSLFFGLNQNTSPFDFLIVTSGNSHGEPIAIDNLEAKKSLSTIADFFLFHNREIKRRADDSIATLSNDYIQFWRQGRGLSPVRLKTKNAAKKNILALGPELKNTITLYYENTLITSPHIGSLDNPKAAAAFIEMSEKIPLFYKKSIEAIAVDQHPHYFSSEHGREQAKKFHIPCIEVQHHHAHAKAVMVEHQLKQAIAIIFDGTGFGDDQTIWGGELLLVDQFGFKRLGHLTPFPLAGGEKAISSPFRIALSFLDFLSDSECADFFSRSVLEISTIRKSIQNKINTPLTSSMGRLFDAASAILKISPADISYEGEAAIKFEKMAISSDFKKNKLPFNIIYKDEKILIDPQPLLIDLFEKKISTHQAAFSFHYTVAEMILTLATYAQENTNYENRNDIVLSGGVFQNKLLLKLSTELLRNNGFNPIISHRFPPGDGQISIGQAVIANERFNLN